MQKIRNKTKLVKINHRNKLTQIFEKKTVQTVYFLFKSLFVLR